MQYGLEVLHYYKLHITLFIVYVPKLFLKEIYGV